MNAPIYRRLSCLLLLWLVTAAAAAEDAAVELEEDLPARDPTLVAVKQGLLRGAREQAIDDKEFFSFRGIPFAKPPVGENRFKPSEESSPWEGERDALAEPPVCPQMTMISLITMTDFKWEGQEDCLYLNVFSPMPQLEKSDRLLPVMVFIHGGGYMFGSASQYNPNRLMTQDIVLVVLQYRLGTLGFLSTEDEAAPGNMGILDQTLALKWVQDNVDNFGGNPLMITIFGESAGGSSVHLQMLSHTSLGFFHRAILQSGTALSPWAMAENHREAAYYIGHVLDCHKFADLSTTTCVKEDANNTAAYNACLVNQLSSEQLITCLKSKPADVLAETCTWFFQFNMFPLMMGPRTDKNLLMQDPALLLKEQRFKKLDIMIGVTKDEGAINMLPIYANEGLRSAMRFNFKEKAPLSLDFGAGDIAPLNMSIKIFDYYVGNSDFDADSADQLTAMFGDRMFWYSADTTMRFHATNHLMKKNKKNAYFYEFSYLGEHSSTEFHNLEIGKDYVTHADDLIYLFGGFQEDGSLGASLNTEDDKKMSEIMVKLWTNFAATGNPTPEGEPIQWRPYTADSPDMLVIDKEPRMESTEKKKEIREFWRQLPLKVNLILFPESVGNLTIIEIKPDVQEARTDTEPTTKDSEAGSKEATAQPVETQINKDEL